MVAVEGRTPGRNSPRIRGPAAKPTIDSVLSRSYGSAFSLAGGICPPPVAANRTNRHRTFTYTIGFLEKPRFIRYSAHPVSGTPRPSDDRGSARSPSLVAVSRAALPRPFRH